MFRRHHSIQQQRRDLLTPKLQHRHRRNKKETTDIHLHVSTTSPPLKRLTKRHTPKAYPGILSHTCSLFPEIQMREAHTYKPTTPKRQTNNRQDQKPRD